MFRRLNLYLKEDYKYKVYIIPTDLSLYTIIMYHTIIILYIVFFLRPRSHEVGQIFSSFSLILVICRLVIKSAIPGDAATIRLLTKFLHVGG